ncbi:MBL fold metallo-hydrolase [Burkholderia pseudomallei]|uniref:Metallo-beta lactamase-related protein n=15 Tax=Burkholderia pseudomallei TaxID=28450 RepID=Q63N12_BURPS|nr:MULTISPECIES: MBL fold metallo-hydrolase [Burkholderia]EIF60409.1 metallo-beta lactamase-related protein [Burkholderia pseudomallei 1258a]KGW45498.1 metallo-beta-lactamase superfamily protein [Burkholderia pseudomallei MSHR684]KGX76905.1 metallo-beta-lactamase superfamily protein [Burkholderia pseudomallei MSHR435]ABA51472.1 putative metallo-beta lactamase-related protein [Burkholderia pseudomallei 1710b]AFI68804.1 metallo-beta lactamase-related protein [Burkholderia pseudomallei 1026b]
MQHGTPGRIDSRLAIVGTADVPLYVIVNDEAATLVEGGLSGMTELVWRQLHELLSDYGGIRHLRYWLITHSHYDHCSLLGTLAPRMPWLHIVGSAATADALQSPSACRTIRALDAQACAAWEPVAAAAELSDIPLYPLNPGRSLDIGEGMRMRALALPGHSACLLGYHCPQLDLLFVSDALGEYHAPTQWLPLVFQDLAAYRLSLDAIERQHASRIALGHHGIVGGGIARHAVRHARDGLAARDDEARAARGDANATRALARQWTERYAARSANVVPRALHLKSMERMIDLFQRAA